MAISSHRLRVEEKKVYRKLLFSLFIFFFFILLIIFAGIPLLTKTIVFLASFRKENIPINISSDTRLQPPILDPLYEATNSSPISVSGISEQETSVKIILNEDEVAKVLADKDGRFTAKNIRLTEGGNTIVAIALKADIESSPSSYLTIVYQKNPPKLEINTPLEGQKLIAEAKDITVSGETDTGNKITINDRFVIVGQDGKFNYKVTLSDGDNNFKIIATDIAGNQTIVERRVTYTP